jgi:hypothetical protein
VFLRGQGLNYRRQVAFAERPAPGPPEQVDPALAAAHEEFVPTVYGTAHPLVRVLLREISSRYLPPDKVEAEFDQQIAPRLTRLATSDGRRHIGTISGWRNLGRSLRPVSL